MKSAGAAISQAHGDDRLWNSDAETGQLCGRCTATLDVAVLLASRLVGRGELSPLIEVFELELLWRDEMARWTKTRPDARFDRAAWRADRDRMQTEHSYTDHYRGQVPPWVISQAGGRRSPGLRTNGAW